MKRARKRYVGLDVHKDVVEYCILDASGKKIDGDRIVCEQSVLKRFATKILSPKDHVALEATTNTWSIVDILEPHVAKIVVGNPLKTKAIAEAKIKTDKIDAMILAQLLRCDFLPTVWIPDAKTRILRRLSSFRKSLVQDSTAAKNRIKGILNHLLVKHDVTWMKDGFDELKRLDIPLHERTIMDCEIVILEHLKKQIENVEMEIKKLAYEEENVRLLMTLPGVDYNTATAVVAAWGDISRFKDADHAASYLGLVPGTKKSANSCYHGPITKTGASLARSLLCEGAQCLSRNDGPLGVFVRRLLQKKPWNIAIVAGARKLATIAYHILKNKEPYRYASVVRTQEKLRRLRKSVTGKRLEQRYRYDKKLREDIPKGEEVCVRFIPPLSDVYEKEGLPSTRPYNGLSDGEKRAIDEMGLTEQVQKTEKVQVIVSPKKIK
ncbi:MAG: IS110 family transposase [Planctomycetaceae bacterium]|nr:IS110 family transposase [Planctomycetaceae bacterium]